MLGDAKPNAANAECSSRLVYQRFDVFCKILFILTNLRKPDLLHTMQIGMLDHLQEWIFHFMKTHQGFNKSNAIWLSVPAYHNLTPKHKSNDEVSQWNKKELDNMSWYLLGVVTQSVRGGSHAQHSIFNHAISCTLALIEFYMYAPYTSHDDATLNYMEDTLHCNHTFQNVFLLGRAGNKANAKAHALGMKLVKMRKVDEETNLEC
jgi:hypothetical protein